MTWKCLSQSYADHVLCTERCWHSFEKSFMEEVANWAFKDGLAW